MNARSVLSFLMFWGAALTFADAALAEDYRPDHPVVRRMVEKGAQWLARNGVHSMNQFEMGHLALMGLALKKADYPNDEPIIQQAVDRIRSELRRGTVGGEWDRMYSSSIALLLLCELGKGNPKENYESEINKLVAHIQERQMANGAWSYTNLKEGDTSQTQYCCLALWYAHSRGFAIDERVAERAMKWLVATQTSDGGFVYHPALGESTGIQRPGQTTLSLSAAGLGSLYVLTDLLGITRGTSTPATDETGAPVNSDGLDGLLPPTVVIAGEAPTDDEESKPKTDSTIVNRETVMRALRRGDEWFKSHFSIRVPINESWNYYYLYAYERYESFRERANGKQVDSPFWYYAGVEFLMDAQTAEGYWGKDNEHSSHAAATSMAILFLLRSSRAVPDATWVNSTLQSGHILNEGVEYEMGPGNRVVISQVTRSVEALLSLVEQASDDEIEAFALSLKGLTLEGSEQDRERQLTQVGTLTKHADPRVREIAVQFLGQQRNFAYIPILIDSLNDQDAAVRDAALSALRYTSRRFSAAAIPSEPTGDHLEAVIQEWKQWYSTVVF
jgi:HEAT repeats